MRVDAARPDRTAIRRTFLRGLRWSGLLCLLAMTACITPPVVSKDISIELKPRFWNATYLSKQDSKKFHRKYPHATYLGSVTLKARVNNTTAWLIDPISDSDLADAGSDYGAEYVSRGFHYDGKERGIGYFGRPGAVYTRTIQINYRRVSAHLYSTDRNLHLVAHLSRHTKPKLKKILAGIRSGKLRRLSLPMKSREAREDLFSRAVDEAYLAARRDFERTRMIAEIEYAWAGVDHRKDIRGQMARYQKKAADMAAAKAKKEAWEKEKIKRKKAEELFDKQKWLALVVTEGFDHRLKLPPKWESLADHKLAALDEGRQVSRYVRMGKPTKFTKPQIWLDAVAVNAALKVHARALFKDPNRSCNHRDPFQIDKRPDGTTLLSVAHRSTLPGGRTSVGRCYLILRPGARKRLFVKTHWQAAGYESSELRPMFEAIVATIEVEPQRTAAEKDALHQKNLARMQEIAARIRRLQAAKKKAAAESSSETRKRAESSTKPVQPESSLKQGHRRQNQLGKLCRVSCERAKQCAGIKADCDVVCKDALERGEAIGSNPLSGPLIVRDKFEGCLAHIRTLSCPDTARLAKNDPFVWANQCPGESPSERRRLAVLQDQARARQPLVSHDHAYFTIQIPATWAQSPTDQSPYITYVNRASRYEFMESGSMIKYQLGSTNAEFYIAGKTDGFPDHRQHITVWKLPANGTVKEQAKEHFKASPRKRQGTVPKKGTIRHETWSNGMEVSSYFYEYRLIKMPHLGILSVGRYYLIGLPGKDFRLVVKSNRDPDEKDSSTVARLDQIVESIRFK